MSDKMLDQLEAGIEALQQNGRSSLPDCDGEVRDLLRLGAQLTATADPAFRAYLKEALLEIVKQEAAQIVTMEGTEDHETGLRSRATWVSFPAASGRTRDLESVPFTLMPSLFGTGQYPVQRTSFMASLAAHAAAVALIVTSGIWAAQGIHEQPRVHAVLLTDLAYVLPASTDLTQGGGGGGDRDKLAAPKGTPPRFTRDQLTPPLIVVRNPKPELPEESTVVGPPNLSFPQTSQLGDPLSRVLGPASNGTGSEGGIGTGDRGGVGPGRGPGVGPGWGGGIGDGPYRIGEGGITAPRATYDPEPDYSEEARKAKYQGTSVLQVVIDAAGIPRDVRVARAAGMGLDEKAIEAVRRWRFQPGMKDGRPVAVLVNVQVNFRLY